MMKVEVELPELPEGYEYTGKMFPEKGDEYFWKYNREISGMGIWHSPAYAQTSGIYPVVRKKQLTYTDLTEGEWFRFADESSPWQRVPWRFVASGTQGRPVVRIKWEDVK